ncbi:hypothetical protein E4U53_001172 [Claviceps sorghi]|nr:hypothetical protein E4U53_001172 [Claviceps sorghi]
MEQRYIVTRQGNHDCTGIGLATADQLKQRVRKHCGLPGFAFRSAAQAISYAIYPKKPPHLSLEPAMHSPSELAEQGRGETAQPHQEEEGLRNQGEHAGTVSLFQDQYDNNSTNNVDLSVTGLLVTDNRPDPQGTTSSNNNTHGSSFCSHQPASIQSGACHSRLPGNGNPDEEVDEETDEDLSDIEDGAVLDQAPYEAQQLKVELGSHLSGNAAEGVDGTEEKSDDSPSEVSEADVTNAQQETANNDPTTSPHHSLHPHLNFSGPPNFPTHYHALYGSPLMTGTDFPDAAWAEGSWPVTGNVDLQGPNPLAEANTLGLEDAANALAPVQISNPNPAIPGSENLGLVDFLHHWAQQGSHAHTHRSRPPHLHQVVKQARSIVNEINYSDLNGDCCDFQALNWTAMDTTRNAARIRRYLTYKNYVNRAGSDVLTV